MAIRKLMSLQVGYDSLPGSYNSPLHPTSGTFSYTTQTSDWVKYFVSMGAYYGAFPEPRNVSEAWSYLAASPLWAGLDNCIAGANLYGLGVIVTINSDTPLWAQLNPGTPWTDGNRHPWPSTGINTPFGWFLSYLAARYKPGIGTGIRASAPAPALTWGNPVGGYLNAIEVLNEPNLLWAPQTTSPPVGSPLDPFRIPANAGDYAIFYTSAAIITAEAVLHAWGQAPGGGIALLCAGATERWESSNYLETNYVTFTRGVLATLQNISFRIPAFWSLHNYSEVGLLHNDFTRTVYNLLGTYRWKGGIDRKIFVTESGYSKHIPSAESPPEVRVREELTQASVMQTMFAVNQASATAIPELHTLAQHEVYDPSYANGFLTGLFRWPDELRRGTTTPYGIGVGLAAQVAWGNQSKAGSP